MFNREIQPAERRCKLWRQGKVLICSCHINLYSCFSNSPILSIIACHLKKRDCSAANFKKPQIQRRMNNKRKWERVNMCAKSINFIAIISGMKQYLIINKVKLFWLKVEIDHNISIHHKDQILFWQLQALPLTMAKGHMRRCFSIKFTFLLVSWSSPARMNSSNIR